MKPQWHEPLYVLDIVWDCVCSKGLSSVLRCSEQVNSQGSRIRTPRCYFGQSSALCGLTTVDIAKARVDAITNVDISIDGQENKSVPLNIDMTHMTNRSTSFPAKNSH